MSCYTITFLFVHLYPRFLHDIQMTLFHDGPQAQSLPVLFLKAGQPEGHDRSHLNSFAFLEA